MIAVLSRERVRGTIAVSVSGESASQRKHGDGPRNTGERGGPIVAGLTAAAVVIPKTMACAAIARSARLRWALFDAAQAIWQDRCGGEECSTGTRIRHAASVAAPSK